MKPAAEVAAWFLAHVNKTETCWLWTAGVGGHGYGSIPLGDRRFLLAHRYAWAAANGEIPKGMSVLHHCDVKLCVNPAHLFVGTHKTNMEDMVAKRRHWAHTRPDEVALRGEANGFAKLTEDSIKEIRTLYAAGGITQRQIAAWFGVSQLHVSRIVRRLVWAHVP